MSCSAEVRIENRQEWYTCGDIVHGSVLVHQEQSSRITELIIELVGEFYCILFDGSSEKEKGERIYKDRLAVMPELPMKSYTMKKGTHEFRFQFVLPGHSGEHHDDESCQAQLLPSFETATSSIRYVVRAKVRRTSNWKFDVRAERRISTRPCIDQAALAGSTQNQDAAKVSMVRKRDLKLKGPELEATLTIQALSPATTPKFRLVLHSDQVEAVKVTKINVQLMRRDKVRVKWSTEVCNLTYNLQTTEPMRSVELVNGSANISDLLAFNLSNSVLPSFHMRFVKSSYRLRVELVVECNDVRRKLTLEPKVEVVSGFVHDHSPAYEEPPRYEQVVMA